MSDNNLIKNSFGLSGFTLKIVALITMIIDHTGAVLFPEIEEFRIIGRIAFPIYVFLVVEGVFHTSNIKRYLIRLLVFAAISEIPFNLMVSNSIFNIHFQNVFFTLAIGVAMMWAMNVIAEKYMNPMLSTFCLLIALVVAWFAKVDYAAYGIALMYLFYCYRYQRIIACVGMAVASVVFGGIQWLAILSIPFILLYNGERGRVYLSGKWLKYTFYGLYPIHIMVLVLIRMILK